MKLLICVGDVEMHILEFTWGQLFGTARIKLDGTVVYRGRPIALDEVVTLRNPSLYLFRTFNSKTTPTNLVRSWELEVGSTEKHRVRIDKIRPQILAGLRPSVFQVFIDEKLVDEQRGY
ncbi:MAG TPA: hypothetical protein VGP68_14700 [Gemmataceae bacterium]|jgi:hypothetical protein|nr:hypothetical protein [Gemmataceae bacterium]